MTEARATMLHRRPVGKSLLLTVRGARLLSLFVLLAVLFLSGALLRPMNGDADMFSAAFRAGQETQAVQVLGAVIYAVAAAYLCWNYAKLRFSREVVLIIAVVGLAFCSVSWSADPGLCFRRAVAFAGTSIFGLTLATALSKQQILFLLNRFAIVFIFATLVLALLAPHYAFHQGGELAGFAGLLRGSYPHKNALGHFLGLFLTIFVMSGRQSVGRGLYIATIVVGVGLLVATRNIGSIFGLIAALGTMRVLLVKSLKERLFLILLILLAAVLFYLIWQTVFVSVLDFVGKDATLSDRTLIWRLVIMAGADNWLLGNGYGVAWKGVTASIVQHYLYSTINNAHNGYLEVWLELGVVGLALFCAIILSAGANLLSSSQTLKTDEFSQTSVAFFVYLLVTNVATSYLMTFNDLNWCLVVTFSYLSAVGHRSVRIRQLGTRRFSTLSPKPRLGLSGARRL